MFSEFRRNVSWLSIAEVTRMICWWGVLIVIGKFLGVDAVGQFGLAMALTAPVMMFMNLGLRKALATDVAGSFPFHFYSTLRLATNAGFAVIVLGTSVVLGYGSDELVVIAIFSAYKAIQSQSDICYGLFQRELRLDLVARSILIRSLLALLFVTLGITATDRLIEGISGMVLAELLVYLFYDRKQLRRFLVHESEDELAVSFRDGPLRQTISTFAEKKSALGSLALQAFPLGLAGLLGSLQLNLPRLVVEDVLGLTALGYFTAVTAFYAAITRVINTLGHSASARLALDYRDGKRRDYLILLGAMGIAASIVGLSATIVAFAFGGEVLALFFADDYAAYGAVFGLVMVATWLRLMSNLWQAGIVATRRFWLNVSVDVIVTLVIAVTTPLLVKEYLLTGAAWSLIVGSGVHFLGVVTILGFLVLNLVRAR